MKKATMQDIANALSVSRITVWKALNNRGGVSEELRKKIFQKSQELNYKRLAVFDDSTRRESFAVGDKHQAPRSVALVISRPESSVFWMQIIHQISKELLKQNINLIYTYLPSTYHKSYVLPGTLSPGQVDGMIVLNVYSNELLKKLSSLDIPKVFLDTTPAVPFDSLNGDLVLIEGKNTVRSITLSVIDSGIDDIIFIGDTEYAQTNMDRLWGFKQAVEERNLNIDMSRCLTGHLPLHAHYEEISRFLAALVPFPQAIICASDYIAHFVQRYCNTNDRAKNTIITGFDNNKEYRNVADCITTAHVQTDTLGTRLADKIIFRMVNKSASFEVAYISSKIIQNRHE